MSSALFEVAEGTDAEARIAWGDYSDLPSELISIQEPTCEEIVSELKFPKDWLEICIQVGRLLDSPREVGSLETYNASILSRMKQVYLDALPHSHTI